MPRPTLTYHERPDGLVDLRIVTTKHAATLATVERRAVPKARRERLAAPIPLPVPLSGDEV